MTADLQSKSYVSENVLYMAMELSNSKWLLAFGDGVRISADRDRPFRFIVTARSGRT